MAITPPTSTSPQVSPRLDPLSKNETLTLAVLKVLDTGIPQLPEGESDSDEWTIDDWNHEPLSPETIKRYQEFFAKHDAKVAAKQSKAKASHNHHSIFG